MTAKVMIIDDLPINIKVLQAKLESRYYTVVCVTDSTKALQFVKIEQPDVILLDLMMPIIDGFELCNILKRDEDTCHIPIIMITALNDTEDLLKGLEAGADEFLSKPANDTILFTRISSLVRMKMNIDELRARYIEFNKMNNMKQYLKELERHDEKILIFDEDNLHNKYLEDILKPKFMHVMSCKDARTIMQLLSQQTFDIIIISYQIKSTDPLLLCSQIKNNLKTRHIPILLILDDSETDMLININEVRINDYIFSPLHPAELLLRIKSQIKNKRYQDELKNNMDINLKMSLIDPLTECHNRRGFDTYISHLVTQITPQFLALLILDIDNFKKINDSYGHIEGDRVLRQCAKILKNRIRASDFLARYGGEEFVLVASLPNKDTLVQFADKLCKAIVQHKFNINAPVTISIGSSIRYQDGNISYIDMIKRADTNLYRAKKLGKNRACHED